ncbi:MAG: hypothetical protein JWP52_3022 [Rhizobacter sp.]|nr:hypothetical protein [Rhizobacter sp.]
MDELIQLVARRAGLTPAQAEAAVQAVLEHFTARLPSPVVGRIHEMLRGLGADGAAAQNQGPPTEPPAGSKNRPPP